MRVTYDVVVAGLGVTGASIACALAQRRQRVLGLDLHAPPHTLGSTHGRSRVIRAAYYENPLYVPLAMRAFELWRQLEQRTRAQLLRRTGALMIGPANGEIVRGTLASVQTHALPHEVLDPATTRRRFPDLRPHDHDIAVLEAGAGMLDPEACVEALLAEAQRNGADLRLRQPLEGWQSAGGAVTLRTGAGEVTAGALILALGPWLPAFTRAGWPGRRLQVERQYFLFFEPRDGRRIGPEACPITLWEYEPDRVFYTLPDTGAGLKAALHHEGSATDPETVDRSVSAEEEARVRTLLEQLIPAAAGGVRERQVCLYTNTKDHHFLIDRHPDAPGVLVVSACSGHGFKFGPAIGEAVADWVMTDRRPASLEAFCDRSEV